MMKRLLFVLPTLIFVVVVGYMYWGLNPDRDPSAVPSVMIDKPVPEFELPPIEGFGTPGFSSADLKDSDKVILVNIFASWCVPCRAEHPILMDLAKRSDIRIFGINYKDKPSDAREWLAELGNPYERIGADAGPVAIDWGVYGVPETFIIDRAGKIRYRNVGQLLAGVVNNEVLPLAQELNK